MLDWLRNGIRQINDMNRLPPLRALQIFDAVIRYGGVVAAAEALHVTPGAISQQIRVLEDFLGVTLFERENTGLRPTPLCELYHSHISRGFECFHSAQAALTAHTGRRLTLMTFPSIATHWLASRLDTWHTICPHVQVHVEVVDHETSIGARSADVRLTYGALPNDGTPYHVLFTDSVAPVFAPSLLQAERPVSQPADILRYPLIHVEWGWANRSPPTWGHWLHAVGVPLPEVLAPLTYSVSGMAIDAAIRGRGISLGQGFFAIDSIKRHDLVAPFKIALPMPFPYFICWKRAVADSPATRQFLDWLIGEAEQTGRDIKAVFGD